MTEYVKKTGTVVVGNSNKRILVTLERAEDQKYNVDVYVEPTDATLKATIDGVVIQGQEKITLNVSSGSYQIEASHPNCTTKTQTITVNTNGSVVNRYIELDFKDTYMGSVNLLSYNELREIVPVTQRPWDYVNQRYIDYDTKLSYHKIKTYDNKQLLIPFATSICGKVSFNTIKESGIFTQYPIGTASPIQGKIVNIDGQSYRCRLLVGDYPNRRGTFRSDYLSSECIRLLKIIDESSYIHPGGDTRITVSLKSSATKYFVDYPTDYYDNDLDRTNPGQKYVDIFGNDNVGSFYSMETNFDNVQYSAVFAFELVDTGGSNNTLTINTSPNDANVLVTGPNQFTSTSKVNSLSAGEYRVKAFKGYNAIDKMVTMSGSNKTESLILPASNVRAYGFNKMVPQYTPGKDDTFPTDLPISTIKDIYPVADIFVTTDDKYYKLKYHTDRTIHVPELISIPKILKAVVPNDYATTIFFICEDGVVRATGSNHRGCMGLGSGTNKYEDIVEVPVTNVKDIVSSNSSTFFILNDGTVRFCGNNTHGQAGLGNTEDYSNITTIPVTNVKSIYCNGVSTIFVMNDGTAKGCGHGITGLFGTGQIYYNPVLSPVSIPLANIKDAIISDSATYFTLTNNDIYVAGANNSKQLQNSDTQDITTPIKFSLNATNIKRIIPISNTATLFLMANGTLKGSGRGSEGQLGLPLVEDEVVGIRDISITGVKDIPVVDSRYSLLHMNDGTVKGMGEPTYSWNLFSTPETLGTIVNCNYGVVNKVISDGSTVWCIK